MTSFEYVQNVAIVILNENNWIDTESLSLTLYKPVTWFKPINQIDDILAIYQYPRTVYQHPFHMHLMNKPFY